MKAAYKALIEIAVTLIHDIAANLTSANPFPQPDNFNYAYLFCLPKKASFIDAVLGAVFAPSKTRPLSIVNTDNRIIAGAFRLVLEPIFNEWISESQRGFLSGRSMLANVLDVEHEAML